MSAWLRSKWQSLIFRLLLYFLLSFLAIAIILVASFALRLKPHMRHEVLPNIERYIEYLTADIGTPPDLQVAQRLADELPFQLRIEGPGLDWASTPRLGPIEKARFRPAPPPYDDVYIGRRRHNGYLLVARRGYNYLFVLDDGFGRISERRHWLLFVVLGGTLLVLYVAIRRLFRPIAAISAQVDKIGSGDLGQRIDESGSGELALLAHGVNRMSQRIRSMLEGKSALLLAISHELRSPLTRLRINLELLDDSEVRGQLIEDVREMESLLASILEAERLGAPHAPLNREPTAMADLIEGVVGEHPCRGRIRVQAAPIALEVDRLRMRLLLKNLLDNACRYSTPDDGSIDVDLEDNGQRIGLQVSDRGVGIDASEIPRLTDAFYRPDGARRRETGGYGLGLYLCRLIAEAHNGKLIIESARGNGTRVRCELPR